MMVSLVTLFTVLLAGNLLASTRQGDSAMVLVRSDDLVVYRQGDHLVMRNVLLNLTFDTNTGEWDSLNARTIPGNMLTYPSIAVDFKVNDRWMIEENGATFVDWNVSVDNDRKGVSVELKYGILPEGSGYAYEIQAQYTLRSELGRIERSAILRRLQNAEKPVGVVEKMQGFRFSLPGIVLDRPEHCVIDVPGPWFPNTFVRPHTPYDSLLNRSLHFHSAPDAGFGVLALSNPRRNMSLSSWMNTAGETNYRPAIIPKGGRLDFIFENNRAYRLYSGVSVTSDPQWIEIVEGPVQDTFSAYRTMVEKEMPLDSSTPDWTRRMVLLEIFPKYYPGGFREITRRLPFYRSIGFNTIYLMPHWTGEYNGYHPISLYEVNPALGTKEDLQELVREAHRLDMRVLFDMVIHGFSPNSRLMQERPDLFFHDEEGDITPHSTWKSMSTDWASSAYQQYMVKLVLHDLRTYDIDGYRVDAASFKDPNWDPSVPYPAYRSGTAAPELMQKMIDAMRRIKPQAVLLSEVFGPVFYTTSNLGHDNQTEAVQQFIEMMEAGKVTAEDYKTHITHTHDLLPAGANRVYFSRNHDTSWFYHFNGYTPRFMAFEAIHALIAIPEIFAGDPMNGPHPDDDPETYLYYRKLFSARNKFPALASGELLLREITSDDPSLFTALRRSHDDIVCIIVSLNDTTRKVSISIDPHQVQATDPLVLFDPIRDTSITVSPADGKWILEVKPFQVLIGEIQ